MAGPGPRWELLATAGALTAFSGDCGRPGQRRACPVGGGDAIEERLAFLVSTLSARCSLLGLLPSLHGQAALDGLDIALNITLTTGFDHGLGVIDMFKLGCRLVLHINAQPAAP